MSEESPGKNWKPCFSDPERGVAFFDGLEVHADPITDPRIDRVIPIFKEEQIFVCRHMTHLFDGAPLVLDVGTGSGVYGLWAAKNGCRVIGVDMEARAIRMARENAQRNDIEEVTRSEVNPGDLPDLIQDTQPGSITLLRQLFNESFVSGLKGITFDVVILSPPYTPTSEKLPTPPARHAASGKDGQKCFRNQAECARDVISDDGIIVGNQMTRQKDSTTGVNGLEASEILNPDSSDEDYQITYVPIIEESHDIADFLRRQYANVSSLGDNDLDRYISDVTGEGEYKNWKLVYYESKKTDARLIDSQGIEYKSASPSCPAARWEKRISAHRKVVENVADTGHIPTPSLFMRRSPGSSLENGSDGVDRPEYSQIPTLNRWVQREIMHWADDESAAFDVLFVDSAPAFDTIGGWDRELEGEYKLWISEKLKEGKDFEEKDIIKEWHKNTIFLQSTGTGPFVHPSFMREHNQKRWADLHYSFLNKQENYILGKGELRNIFPNEENVNEFYDKKVSRSNRLSGAEKGRGGIYIDDSLYSKVRLEELGVKDRNRISVYDRLGKPAKDSNQGRDEQLDEDLNRCHELMHREITRRVDDLFAEGRALEWSCLIGMPLTLIPENGKRSTPKGANQNAGSTLPEHYRGGIWIWGGSLTDEWSKAHDDDLFEMSRLAWLLYNGAYNREATRSASELASRRKEIQFGHRISGSVEGVVDTLKDELDDMEKINVPPEAYILKYKSSLSQETRPGWPIFDRIIESGEDVAKKIICYIWDNIASEVASKRVKQITDDRIRKGWSPDLNPKLKQVGRRNDVDVRSKRDLEDLASFLVPLLIEACQHTLLYEILHNNKKDNSSGAEFEIRFDEVEIRNPFHEPIKNPFGKNKKYDIDELLSSSNQKFEIEKLQEITKKTWTVEWPKDRVNVGEYWTVTVRR